MKDKLLTLFFILASTSIYAQWWEAQNSGVTANLNDVYCINENIVIVVGDGGTILKTVDGGQHWIQKNSGTNSYLKKVQFANNTTGYAVGDSGTLLKTTDGGESWITIATGFTTDLTGLSVLDESIFYISGYNGLIKRTNNGGTTFIDRGYASAYPYNTIQFLNESVGYASSYDPPPYGFSGDNSTFIKTTDGGVTWTLSPDHYVTSFHFLTEDIGFLRNNYGISKTTDGGLNMIPIGDPGFQTPDIFSLNENIVWYVSNNFTLCDCSYFCIHKIILNDTPNVLETQNCYADTNGAPPFLAIRFANETTGYAIGVGGRILKNSTGEMGNLSRNEFEKRDFIQLYPNPSSNQITISFSDGQNTLSAIEITDILGKTIFSKLYDNQNESTINVESFSNGAYFVKIHTSKGIDVRKFIKQ